MNNTRLHEVYHRNESQWKIVVCAKSTHNVPIVAEINTGRTAYHASKWSASCLGLDRIMTILFSCHNRSYCAWFKENCFRVVFCGWRYLFYFCSISVPLLCCMKTLLYRVVLERESVILFPLTSNTVWCRYKAVNILENSHNGYPIAHGIRRAMGCLLWV